MDFTRGNAKAADYLDSLGDACLLSTMTARELIAGARSQREVNDLDVMISAYEQMPPTAALATKNRKHFQTIGDLDLGRAELPGSTRRWPAL